MVPTCNNTANGMASITDVLKDLAAKINNMPSLHIPKRVSTIPAPSSYNTNTIWTDSSTFAKPPPMAAQQTMLLPLFNGTKPLTWLARATQYFIVHQTPVPQRIPLALIAFSGQALSWIQSLLHRDSTLSWDTFSKELLARFDEKNIAEIQAEFSIKCDRKSAAFGSPLSVSTAATEATPADVSPRTSTNALGTQPRPQPAVSALNLSARAAVPELDLSARAVPRFPFDLPVLSAMGTVVVPSPATAFVLPRMSAHDVCRDGWSPLSQPPLPLAEPFELQHSSPLLFLHKIVPAPVRKESEFPILGSLMVFPYIALLSFPLIWQILLHVLNHEYEPPPIRARCSWVSFDSSLEVKAVSREE